MPLTQDFENSRSARDASKADNDAVSAVAEKIAAEVDRVLSAGQVSAAIEITLIEPV
jgi:hypothetical protein